jgi:hypothetical protein
MPTTPRQQATPAATNVLTPHAFSAAAPRKLCTNCGISRSTEPQRCGRTWQFIKPGYLALDLRREHAAKIKNLVPARVWLLVQPRGLAPGPEERP